MKRSLDFGLLFMAVCVAGLDLYFEQFVVDKLFGAIPSFILEGFHFAYIAAIGLLLLMLALSTVARVRHERLTRLRNELRHSFILAGVCVALALGLGAIFQFVYALELTKPESRNIAVLMDNSGSMLDSDPKDTRYDALETFIRGLDGNQRLAVFTYQYYDYECKYIFPLQTLDRSKMDSYIETINTSKEAPASGTDINLALNKAADAVEGESGATEFILISDGQFTGTLGEPLVEESVIQRLMDMNIKMHCISVFMDQIPETMQMLATRTNGDFWLAKDANALAAAMKKAAGGQSGNYLLSRYRSGEFESSALKAAMRIVFLFLLFMNVRIFMLLIINVKRIIGVWMAESAVLCLAAATAAEFILRGAPGSGLSAAYVFTDATFLSVLTILIAEGKRKGAADNDI